LSDLSFLANVPVIPVLTIERVADAIPLARALVDGGLPVLEVTLRTGAALEAAERIAREVPQAVVGMGTVTSSDDIDAAIRAGAKYLVSPGTPPQLAEAFVGASIPVIPGCATASEAMTLAARGYRLLKFFPAEASGGMAWLRSMSGPLPGLRFCPTGGIDGRNAAAYLALPNVAAVGGSWVAPQDLINAGDFAQITQLARAASRLRG
jgi:2-dehydro-3-deoxyphosphogluconate aldolase/(4S)-4-hydroxy-2-oxoglutarate aldolase